MAIESSPILPLGVQVDHEETYHPGHLFPIPRKEAREPLGLGHALPFTGADIWNAYELSWLDPKGKPRVALGTFIVPCASLNIFESKSLKLYLNSLNQTRFESMDQVEECIRTDLGRSARGEVKVSLFPLEDAPGFRIFSPRGTCIDHLDITTDQYRVDPESLVTGPARVKEILFSNLLRTNCPVTRQPDWATVTIDYTGPALDREGLLTYLVSYRCHTGFHENCVERIFTDIWTRCRPESLTVSAGFTRRGGIDINPVRTTREKDMSNERLVRQ